MCTKSKFEVHFENSGRERRFAISCHLMNKPPLWCCQPALGWACCLKGTAARGWWEAFLGRPACTQPPRADPAAACSAAPAAAAQMRAAEGAAVGVATMPPWQGAAVLLPLAALLQSPCQSPPPTACEQQLPPALAAASAAHRQLRRLQRTAFVLTRQHGPRLLHPLTGHAP